MDYAPPCPHFMQLIGTVSQQSWAFFSNPLILQMSFMDGPSYHVMFALKLPHKINYKLRHQVSDLEISDSAGLAALLRLLVQRGRGARSGPQTPAAAHRHHHAGDIILVSNNQPIKSNI